MEQLAKIGIIITNIGLAVIAAIFTVFMYGFLGFTGLVMAVVMCIASVTTWAMMVSAYNKFMKY